MPSQVVSKAPPIQNSITHRKDALLEGGGGRGTRKEKYDQNRTTKQHLSQQRRDPTNKKLYLLFIYLRNDSNEHLDSLWVADSDLSDGGAHP